MHEAELQAYIEEVVNAGGLYNKIQDINLIESSAYEGADDFFIPSFPIDFLMRKKSILSAKYVSELLQSVEMVSSSNKSISLNKSERMFPDLLLCNVEKKVFIIVELKRSKQTSRETITELLAYEHEVRNHLPFLSTFDVCHLVISTDYPPLLDHSIANLVTWESKQIFCLKVNEDGADISLGVHLPQSWTDIGQGLLPTNSISTAVLNLEPIEGEEGNKQKYMNVIDTAVNIIVQNGNRSNSHGFVMLCDDARRDGVLQLLVGAIDPQRFLPNAIKQGFIKENQSPLVDYLSVETKSCQLERDKFVADKICEKAIRLLEEVALLQWERFSTWEQDRAYEKNDEQFVRGIQSWSVPIKMDFWGALGEYVSDHVTRPIVRNAHLPVLKLRGLDWRTPSIGIELLDEIVCMDQVKSGCFDCKSLFHIGMLLERFLVVAESVSAEKNDILSSLRAQFIWYGASFSKVLKEVGMFYSTSVDDMETPPIVCYDCSPISRTASDIHKWVEWFQTELIGNFDFHNLCFSLGRSATYFLHPYCKMAIDDSQKDEIRQHLIEFGRKILADAQDFIKNDECYLDGRQRCQRIVDHHFATAADQHVSDEVILEGLEGPLFDLLELWIPRLGHELVGIESVDVDWGWVEMQIENFRKRGVEHPVVYFGADGTLGAADIDAIELSQLDYDPKAGEILVCYEVASGGRIIKVTNWDELKDNVS